MFSTILRITAQAIAAFVALLGLIGLGLQGSWLAGLVWAAIILSLAKQFGPSAPEMADLNEWLAHVRAEQEAKEQKSGQTNRRLSND